MSDPDEPASAPGTSDGNGARKRLGEVARLFLRLGVTAFGRPAAHIAMMHEEVVRHRRWVSDERFVDLVGASSLIPGPNSTERAAAGTSRRTRPAPRWTHSRSSRAGSSASWPGA